MATVVFSPVGNGFQWFGQTGLVLSGGKINTYAAGSTTKQATYTDNTGTVANANPIILDSTGRYAQEIWLDSTLLPYKFVITDSLNVTQFTLDNISTATSALSVSYLSPGSGAVTTTVAAKLGDWVSVKDFGAKGDGATDDTTSIQNAITYCQIKGRKLYFPAGTYIISSTLTISATLDIWGDGKKKTTLQGAGAFSALVTYSAAALYCRMEGCSLFAGSSATKCVNIAQGATVIRFNWVEFTSTFVGSLDLAYSNGQNVDFAQCSFNLGNANHWGINFDCFNQNCGVTDSRFGGPGSGLRVTNAFSPANAVTGLRIVDCYFENTGASNVDLDKSQFTTIVGNVLDQASIASLNIRAACVQCTVGHNWIGFIGGGTGTCIQVAAGSTGHVIEGNVFFGGNVGINIGASVGARAGFITICNNQFQSHAQQSLILDSVNGCTIENNVDGTSPSQGSWNTLSTNASHGNYIFQGNRWSSNTVNFFDAASTYRFGNDTGIVGNNYGLVAVSPAATSQTINHGLFKTPNSISYSLEITNLGATWLTAVGATSFTVNWVTSGTPNIRWVATY